MLATRLPLVLLVLGALAADAPKEDDATRADVKAMQGDWAVASMVKDGDAVPDDDAQSLFRTVKGDEYTVYLFRKALGKGTFRVDATKTPRTVDYTPADGPAAGMQLPGIYEWTGKDSYRVCFALPGKERPTDFACKKGSGHTLVVWRREKGNDGRQK
jgi:uncharacterized protein (TIGR03067 family)